MTQLSRAQATALADEIRDETATGANTALRVGGFLHSLIDSTVFKGEAQTPPTAGNGLTGTSVFSVLANGATLDVSPSGVKVADLAGNSILGRAAASSGAPVAITAGSDELALRLAGATLGFGQLTTGAYTDTSVTLAKMANMATDSLLGRDTAGSGAPEVIGLNTTLSMDGSRNLRRAALTGDVSAAVGSNTTAFASGAFGALVVSSTTALSSGTSPASAGAMRLENNGFLVGRLTTNTNVSLIGVSSGDTIGVGDTTAPTVVTGSGSVSLRVGASNIAQALATTFRLLTPSLSFDSSAVAPSIIQTTDATASVTCDDLLIVAQSGSGGTTVQAGSLGLKGGSATGGSGTRNGGAAYLQGGTGASADGFADLRSPAGTSRLKVNATGIGAFAVTPAAQSADMGALTDSTGGTANGTMVDVGAVFSQSNINDNFADCGAKITAIRNCLRAMGYMA